MIILTSERSRYLKEERNLVREYLRESILGRGSS